MSSSAACYAFTDELGWYDVPMEIVQMLRIPEISTRLIPFRPRCRGKVRGPSQ
jgi:hypothetical protein